MVLWWTIQYAGLEKGQLLNATRSVILLIYTCMRKELRLHLHVHRIYSVNFWPVRNVCRFFDPVYKSRSIFDVDFRPK
jgi:hypothetical protein